MIAHEIVLTCSNPNIACAAVASIGGDFARRFRLDAERRNVSSGTLAARLVREFARRAREGDWEDLRHAIRGADMPVLAGLRYILERSVKLKNDAEILAPMMGPPPSILLSRPALCWV